MVEVSVRRPHEAVWLCTGLGGRLVLEEHALVLVERGARWWPWLPVRRRQPYAARPPGPAFNFLVKDSVVF
jgi:hypothetical protein